MKSNFDPNEKREEKPEQEKSVHLDKDWKLPDDIRDDFLQKLKSLCKLAATNDIPLNVLAQLGQKEGGTKGAFVFAGGYSLKSPYPAHPAFKAVYALLKIALGDGTEEYKGLDIEDICDIVEFAQKLHEKRNGGHK